MLVFADGLPCAIALSPGDHELWNARGAVLAKLDRTVEALTSFDRAVAIRPHFADALANRGNLFRELRGRRKPWPTMFDTWHCGRMTRAPRSLISRALWGNPRFGCCCPIRPISAGFSTARTVPGIRPCGYSASHGEATGRR